MIIEFTGDWLPRRQCHNTISFPSIRRVGNLECAFIDAEVRSEKAYTCVLPKSCMDNIPSGKFSALSVANNHVNDASNFRETYAELTKRFPDVQFFGTNDKPFAIFNSNDSATLVLIVGCLEPCRSRGAFIFKQEKVTGLIRELRLGKNRSIGLVGNLKIFVYPHWGKEGEYTRYPAPWQLRLAREWIDAGADGVLGSHSHIPQGREFYNGKPIYYSLGNFDFDHPESRLYPGTEERLTVQIDVGNDGAVCEHFNSDASKEFVDSVTSELNGWNAWKWAQKIGDFNLKKNMSSWKLRLKQNFIKTLPKFLIWQVLPITLLFRAARICCYKQ